jgi:hypothetical protein
MVYIHLCYIHQCFHQLNEEYNIYFLVIQLNSLVITDEYVLVFCSVYSPLFTFFVAQCFITSSLFSVWCFIILRFPSFFPPLFYLCFFGLCSFISSLP